MTTNLQHYDEYNKAYGQGIGASKLKQILWFICSVLFVRNPLHPFSCVRKWTLQLFGAKIGDSTVIRSGVQVKYPWKLKVGNHVWLGENSWIDNLDQVEIGDHTVIAAQAGISGSTKIGKYCMIGGQVGITGHISIADKTIITAKSGVTKSFKNAGMVLGGNPATLNHEFLKSNALIRRLPEILSKVNQLEKQED